MTAPRASRRGVAVAAAIAVAVALVSAAPRIAAAAGLLPDAARPFLWADMLATYDHLAGRAPYWEVPFYYPPLVGYLSGALVKLNANAVAFVGAWALLVAAAAGAIAAIIARRTTARRAILYWAATPQLLLFAGVNFDALALLFVVVAIALTGARRPLLAVAALALGTCVKAFPAALVPLRLDDVRRDGPRLVARAAVFGGIVAAVTLPSLLAPWPITYTVPDYAGKVTSESVWGLVQAALAAASLGQIVAPITVAGLVATYVFGVIPAARRATDPAVGAALALLTVLIWSRIYQPQYSLWIVPFYALMGIPLRWYALLTVADVGVLTSIMFVEAAGAGPSGEALLAALAAAVTLRHVALVGTWAALYRRTLAARPDPPPAVGLRSATSP